MCKNIVHRKETFYLLSTKSDANEMCLWSTDLHDADATCNYTGKAKLDVTGIHSSDSSFIRRKYQ